MCVSYSYHQLRHLSAVNANSHIKRPNTSTITNLNFNFLLLSFTTYW